MQKTIIRVQHFMRNDDFEKLKEKWEEENPETLLIPYTMKVERTKAKWIYKKDEYYKEGAKHICSNCKFGFGVYYDIEEFKYCPHCGAEMEAEE